MADEKKKMSRTELTKKLASVVPLLTGLGVDGVSATAAGTTVSLNVTLKGVTEEQLKTIVDLVNSKLQ